MGSETGLRGFLASLLLGDDCIGQVRVRLSRRLSQRPSEQQQQQQQQQSQQSQDGNSDDDDDHHHHDEARALLGHEIRVADVSPPSDRCRPLLVLHTLSLDASPWLVVDQPPAANKCANNDLNVSCSSDMNIVDDTSSNICSSLAPLPPAAPPALASAAPAAPAPAAPAPAAPAPAAPAAAALRDFHASCLKDSKTAVVPLSDGVNELHLVPVRDERRPWPTFWAFRLRRGVYATCLQMLNLRCLAMVFDLDETLILANTMRSFEDRIVTLRSKIHAEKLKVNKVDGQRVSLMLGELERYQEDKLLLKQFADNNFVMDNGRVIPAQLEEVPATVEGGQPLWRPVIRIPERNLIFTRIVPNVRDTSILVKLRPSWEELRSYLIAKGRKRFEVFICTMSEKEYALEMWRLLDPDASLIDSKQLTERLLCVRSGSKKSLANLFQNVCCHPRLAMVIDDRLDVWEDEDKANLYAVPPFAPYFAPQAEATSPLPVMCNARNVASTIRSSFFRDFDETVSHRFSQLDFETDVLTLPKPPHVADYLSEMVANDCPSLKNSPKNFPDGIAGAEVQTAVYPQAQYPNPSNACVPPGFGYVQASPVNMELVYDPNILRLLEVVQKPAAAPTPVAAPTGGGWLDEDDTNLDSPSTSEHNPNDMREAGEIQEYAKPEVDAPVRDLQEYGKKCNAAIEFKFLVNATIDLLFTSEIFVDGIKAGKATGRTSREAKYRAAENALRYLMEGPPTNRSHTPQPSYNLGFQGRMPMREDKIPVASTSGKQSEERKKPSFNATAALKTLCTIEGLKVNYLERPNSRGAYNCEVEIDGRVLGRGSNDDWETAKHQAAEQALRELNPGMSNSNENQKRSASRTPSAQSKRAKVGDAPPWRPPASFHGRGRDRRPWGRSYNTRR